MKLILAIPAVALAACGQAVWFGPSLPGAVAGNKALDQYFSKSSGAVYTCQAPVSCSSAGAGQWVQTGSAWCPVGFQTSGLDLSGVPDGRSTVLSLSALLRVTCTPLPPFAFQFGSGGANVAANQFVGIANQSAAENLTQQIAGISGRFTAMYCVSNAAPGGAVSVTYTLRVNGANSGVTCTLAGTQVANSTTGLSVPFAAGALLDVAIPAAIGAANKAVSFAVTVSN